MFRVVRLFVSRLSLEGTSWRFVTRQVVRLPVAVGKPTSLKENKELYRNSRIVFTDLVNTSLVQIVREKERIQLDTKYYQTHNQLIVQKGQRELSLKLVHTGLK